MLKISKAVKDGMIVTKNGDKYIRCGRNRRMAGVYQSGRDIVMLTDKGRASFSMPHGIVIKGLVKCLSKE